MICFWKIRRMSSSGFGPLVAPQVTSRPPRASARTLPAQVAAPTSSITTSTPRFCVSPQTSFEKSVVAWLMSTSAPSCRARSSFSSLLEVTKTCAPASLAICSAAIATPPPMPRISTLSPGRTRALVITILQAVRKTSGKAAASSKLSRSGIGRRLTSGITTAWAKVPSRCSPRISQRSQRLCSPRAQ